MNCGKIDLDKISDAALLIVRAGYPKNHGSSAEPDIMVGLD
jgi:hypothetical protein